MEVKNTDECNCDTSRQTAGCLSVKFASSVMGDETQSLMGCKETYFSSFV